MTVAERIKRRRESLGISQTALADTIGITKQQMYKYENGIITNIPSNRIESIAAALNTSPSYLMGWDDAHADLTAAGLSIQDIADELGVPLAMLPAMIENAPPEVIGKLSKAANLLTDEATRKKLGITDKEWDLILQYRKASDKDKAVVDTVLGLK